MEQEKNKIAIYEEIRSNTDLVTKDQFKVPMTEVFGRGTLGNHESFGGKNIVENAARVQQAIDNVGELQNIWNHSHSQWAWKHINMSFHSPIRNMRQVAAEMGNKKNALDSAKWRQVENEIKLRKLEEKLKNGIENGTLDYWKEVELKVKLAQMKEGFAEGMTYIEGAMKDVLALEEIYQQLKSKVSNFSEYDVEKEETISHMKRSLVQCLRDVRQMGAISKGEQEYVEQIGINPSKLQMILKQYVENEAKSDSWDVGDLHEFVDSLARELSETYKVDQKVLLLQGMDPEPNEEFTFINKLALPTQ